MRTGGKKTKRKGEDQCDLEQLDSGWDWMKAAITRGDSQNHKEMGPHPKRKSSEKIMGKGKVNN